MEENQRPEGKPQGRPVNREVPQEEIDKAREMVIQRIESIEAQGGLPIEGWKLTQNVALFDGQEPDAAAKAVWSLVDDKTLVYDQVTDTVDIRERLKRLLKEDNDEGASEV